MEQISLQYLLLLNLMSSLSSRRSTVASSSTAPSSSSSSQPTQLYQLSQPINQSSATSINQSVPRSVVLSSPSPGSPQLLRSEQDPGSSVNSPGSEAARSSLPGSSEAVRVSSSAAPRSSLPSSMVSSVSSSSLIISPTGQVVGLDPRLGRNIRMISREGGGGVNTYRIISGPAVTSDSVRFTTAAGRQVVTAVSGQQLRLPGKSTAVRLAASTSQSAVSSSQAVTAGRTISASQLVLQSSPETRYITKAADGSSITYVSPARQAVHRKPPAVVSAGETASDSTNVPEASSVASLPGYIPVASISGYRPVSSIPGNSSPVTSVPGSYPPGSTGEPSALFSRARVSNPTLTSGPSLTSAPSLTPSLTPQSPETSKRKLFLTSDPGGQKVIRLDVRSLQGSSSSVLQGE